MNTTNIAYEAGYKAGLAAVKDHAELSKDMVNNMGEDLGKMLSVAVGDIADWLDENRETVDTLYETSKMAATLKQDMYDLQQARGQLMITNAHMGYTLAKIANEMDTAERTGLSPNTPEDWRPD